MLLDLVDDTFNLVNRLAEVNFGHDREQPFPHALASVVCGTRHVNKGLAGHATTVQAVATQTV